MADPSTPDVPHWDEYQYEAALKHLDTLQGQLDQIRLTIPSVVQTLVAPHHTPDQLFSAFKEASQGSAAGIRNFRAAWYDGRTRKVLQRADQSYKTTRDLTEAKALPRHGWVNDTEKVLPKEEEIDGVHSSVADPTTATVESDDNIGKVMDDFKVAHPTFQVNTEDGDRVIKINFKATSLPLEFHIVRRRDAARNVKLDVECVGNMNLFPAITRCIASRSRSSDLPYLLDMIASYTDARSASCIKCGRLVDVNALTPAARRQREATDDKDEAHVIWEAIHEMCL